MRFRALVVVCTLASGCGSGEAKQSATAEPREEPEPIGWRDEERGFTVTYPSTWQRAGSRLTPSLGDPLELLALGTYELRPGGDRCAHQPVNALEDLGATDALLVIFERAPPFPETGYPPRRGRPELDRGTGRFCVPRADRLDAWFSFGESGRAFYALLALGGDAPTRTRDELLAIYASLAFDEH